MHGSMSVDIGDAVKVELISATLLPERLVTEYLDGKPSDHITAIAVTGRVEREVSLNDRPAGRLELPVATCLLLRVHDLATLMVSMMKVVEVVRENENEQWLACLSTAIKEQENMPVFSRDQNAEADTAATEFEQRAAEQWNTDTAGVAEARIPTPTFDTGPCSYEGHPHVSHLCQTGGVPLGPAAFWTTEVDPVDGPVTIAPHAAMANNCAENRFDRTRARCMDFCCPRCYPNGQAEPPEVGQAAPFDANMPTGDVGNGV